MVTRFMIEGRDCPVQPARPPAVTHLVEAAAHQRDVFDRDLDNTVCNDRRRQR